MNLGKRLRSLFILLFSISLLLTLGLLFTVDKGSFTQLQDLADRLSKSDKDRQQALVAEHALEPLAPLASQITERRDDLIAGVQALASDGALRALYATADPAVGARKPSTHAKSQSLQQILSLAAAAKKGSWESVELTNKQGKVIAAWPDAKATGRDASKDPLFTQLSAVGVPVDFPVFEFVRIDTPAAKDKSGRVAKDAKATATSQLTLACGIEGVEGNFAGLLSVHMPADKLLGLRLADFLKSVKAISPNASLILMRGTGDQVFNSAKGAYNENFDRIGTQDFKAAMAAMQAQTEGRQWIASYDGKPALLVWKRVGSWQSSAGISALLSLSALLPDEDFKSAAAAPAVEKPAAFWARPIVLLLLALAFGLPLILGIVLAGRQMDPLQRLVQVALQIDEYGAAPEGLEFREELDPGVSRVNQGLNALIARLRTTEGRVHELDGALRRVEDQASRDATSAAQELSELRSKLAGVEAEKAAANAKYDAAQKARQEIESQLANLKSALETAQRSIDLKNSENKNLSTQIQDLMRTLEEQRKVAQQVQESASRREDEMVRLSAVNTLSSELKATLTVIKNYISTMLGSVGAISDAQQEFLGVVINKSARLERLIADLVELSEIGSGIKPPRMETVALSSLVQEALLNARPQADNKKISLEFAESGSVPQVLVDKEKFGAIVRALLSQSVKVTSRGERVSILLSGRDSNLELRITDPGMSLPPDRAAKVFNQFHGVDSQAGPEFIGTGLRFPIMRAIVEAHGGKIWIESQVGRGKTFVISLPKAGSFSPAAPRNMAPAPAPAMPSFSAPPASLPKVTEPEAPGLNSIFGEMPAMPAAPPKPAFAPAAPAAPALPGLPSLGAPPKPAPVPTAAPALPGLPGLGIPAAPAGIPAAPIEFKTEAAKGPLKAEDKESFDAIFGAQPGAGASKPAPIELKTEAGKGPLAEKDLENFAAIFGGTPPKPVGPPPAAGAIPAPPPKPVPAPTAPAAAPDFASIFGDSSKAATPPPPKPAAPGAGPDFAAIFGDAPKPVGPPPAAGAIPAPPPKPAVPAELANFDAIFGSPAAASAPPAAPPAAPAAPKPAGSGMDDLNNMFK